MAYVLQYYTPISNVLALKIDCYTDNIAGEKPAGDPNGLPSWQVCVQLGVSGYPRFLYVSSADELWTKSKETLQTENRVVFHPLVASELLQFINQKINRTWTLPDPAQFAQTLSDHLHSVAHPVTTTAMQMARGAVLPHAADPTHRMDHLLDYHFDVEIATAVLIDHMFRGQPRYGDGLTPEKRPVVMAFIDALERAYPVPQCRASLTQFRRALEVEWPVFNPSDPTKTNVTSIAPDRIREMFSLCNRRDWKLYEKRGWLSCHGTYTWTRGYSCGLWLLFHSLVGHANAAPNDAFLVLLAIRGFVDVFFPCEFCRTHFLEATRSEIISKLKTQRDVVLFVWDLHNQVNARLARDERGHGPPPTYQSTKPGAEPKTEYEMSFSGDPAFPHAIWPTLADCSGCRNTKPVEKVNGEWPRTDRNAPPRWDDDVLYQFLTDRYGSTMLVADDDFGPWSEPLPPAAHPRDEHIHPSDEL